MSSDHDPNRGHSFAVQDDVVIVEYYHFGEDVPYEFAVQLKLDQTSQRQMAKLLGLTDIVTPEGIAQALKDRFVTYYAVRDFADENGVAYTPDLDFFP